MDIKAKDLIGLPVVTYNRGVKAYEVEDMILDPDRRQVLALLVEEGSLFRSAKAVPFGRISAIGPDAVIIPDGKAVIEVNRDNVLKRLHNEQSVRGLRVLTDDGRRLGTVEDLLLDSKTGEVRGYYVSQGRMVSVGQGQRWLPAESVLNMGMRVLYVPASVADDFDRQLGGIAGTLEGAGGKLRTAGEQANQRLENLGEKARESGSKLNEQLGQVGERVRTDVSQRAGGMVAGKTAHDRVVAPDGTPIVEEGETITEEHVERARSENRLNQLFMSAGVRPVSQTASSFADQANQSLSDIGNEARQLWSQLTGNYNRVVDETDDKVMQRRIKSALGRPASRVILDSDDNVILNTGDIITNRAVDNARKAGVLDILVDSVYVDRPKLELEDLKAPSSGHASLEAEGTGTGSSISGVPTRARRSTSNESADAGTEAAADTFEGATSTTPVTASDDDEPGTQAT